MDIKTLFKLGNSGKTVEIPTTEKRNSGISFAEFESKAIRFAEECAGDGVSDEIITLFVLNITGGTAKRGDKEWSISGLIPYWKEQSEDGVTMPNCEFVLLPRGSKYTATNGTRDGEVIVKVGDNFVSMFYSKIEWAQEGSLRSDVILITTSANGVQQRVVESFSIARPLPSSNGSTGRTAADRRAQFERMRAKLMGITEGVNALDKEFE